MDIGADALQLGIEAVAISKINPDTETPELKKKKKVGLISGIVMIILMVGLIYIMFWRWDIFNEVGVDAFGITALLIAFGIALVVVIVIGIASYIKTRNKHIKKIYVLIALSGICTVFIISMLYTELDYSNPLQFIPIIAFTFGITLLFFMLFSKMNQVKLNKFVNLPLHLLIHFFIPMMFVCILFLGVMQGYYGYESVFLYEAEVNLLHIFGEVMGGGLYGIIEIIFNLGATKPSLFLFISAAVTLFLLYSSLRSGIWGEHWPYVSMIEKYVDYDAQHFIDSTDDTFLSKEDIESFNRGKLRLKKEEEDDDKLI